MVTTDDIKNCTIEGLPIEFIFKSYCSRCTPEKYKDCDFSCYSLCKAAKENKE